MVCVLYTTSIVMYVAFNITKCTYFSQDINRGGVLYPCPANTFRENLNVDMLTHIDGLVQEKRNPGALATPVRQQWSYPFLVLTHRYVSPLQANQIVIILLTPKHAFFHCHPFMDNLYDK